MGYGRSTEAVSIFNVRVEIIPSYFKCIEDNYNMQYLY